MSRCWAMWPSTSSSPICATGVARAAMITAMPAPKQAMRQPGTGRPSLASVLERTQ